MGKDSKIHPRPVAHHVPVFLDMDPELTMITSSSPNVIAFTSPLTVKVAREGRANSFIHSRRLNRHDVTAPACLRGRRYLVTLVMKFPHSASLHLLSALQNVSSTVNLKLSLVGRSCVLHSVAIVDSRDKRATRIDVAHVYASHRKVKHNPYVHHISNPNAISRRSFCHCSTVGARYFPSGSPTLSQFPASDTLHAFFVFRSQRFNSPST
ncbi:hypothetical protein EDC04DRAFT_566154 [Pisolithus marmoratus]|nr:hypothetical protein EDC04DRAFT_566154 [Pisolithus marmoratus]